MSVRLDTALIVVIIIVVLAWVRGGLRVTVEALRDGLVAWMLRVFLAGVLFGACSGVGPDSGVHDLVGSEVCRLITRTSGMSIIVRFTC